MVNSWDENRTTAGMALKWRPKLPAKGMLLRCWNPCDGLAETIGLRRGLEVALRVGILSQVDTRLFEALGTISLSRS